MADLFISAVYHILADSAEVTAALAVSPVAGVPGIYTTDPVPENAGLPLIVIRGPITQSPFDTVQETGDGGRDLTIDVNCYADKTGTHRDVDKIANLVRRLLHRKRVEVAGYDWIETIVFGPTLLSFGDAYGKNLAVQLLYLGQ